MYVSSCTVYSVEAIIKQTSKMYDDDSLKLVLNMSGKQDVFKAPTHALTFVLESLKRNFI